MRISALLLSILMIATLMFGCKPAEEPEESEVSSSASSQSSRSDSSSSKAGEPTVEPEELIDLIVEQHGKNNDTVGWLRIPNTTVDDAVVQSKTDSNGSYYYLRRDKNKKSDFEGCYFMDYECLSGDRDDMSQNTIIYGHNVDYGDNPDGVRFGQLFKFLELDFAIKNPYIFFSTAEEDMVWEIFAVFYTEVKLDYIYPEYSEADFARLLNEALDRSQHIYEVYPTVEDKILTLSTCTYKYGVTNNQQRFVVMARLVDEGRELPETVKVKKNPSPKEPNF